MLHYLLEIFLIEYMFLGQLLSNTLGINIYRIQIYKDNISYIKMDHMYKCKCNKHIDVKYYFIGV